MKPGKKKTEKDVAGSKNVGGDDSGTFKVDSDMIGGNPNGIDGIKALMIIAGGIAALVSGWLILHNILHLI